MSDFLRGALLLKIKRCAGDLLASCQGEIIYDEPFNESFKTKLEMIQYRVALSITGAIKGTSHDRLYQEISLQSLADRR